MKKLYIIIVLILFVCPFIGSAQTPSWTSLGPIPFPATVVGQIHGIGRCSELQFHPSDPNKMYTASASGGLWYSANKGATWVNLGTDNITNVQSASLAIDPTNDQIIYWGTGDDNYYSSGFGVYKTTNGGSTWTVMNSGMGNRLVTELIINPANTSVVLAATNGGVYKTTNGGASWTLKSPTGSFQDMCLKAVSGTSVVFACTKSAFYRSPDWGDTWTQITSGLVLDGGGARIGVSPANPEYVYVGVTKAYGAIFRSVDGGTTFTSRRTETTKNLVAYGSTDTDGGQGNYNFDIGVDPTNANSVYLCSHLVWSSADGGATWTQKQTSWARYLHTDQHQILFNPYNPVEIWNVNDGGIWKSTNGGTGAWTPMSDGIAATEIYHAKCSNVNKTINSIGTQDNGEFYSSNGMWYNNRGGDWSPNAYFDYATNYVYYGNADGSGQRKLLPGSATSSAGWSFTVASSDKPVYAFSPVTKTLGFVSNGQSAVYRSTNIGTATPVWSSVATLSARVLHMYFSPTDANRLYVVTTDGKVHRSDNAGSATPTFTTLAGPVTTASTAYIAPTEKDHIVYLAINNKLYRSVNKGASWTDITSGFPAYTIKGLVYDRYNKKEGLYAAYVMGVYYKDTTKTSWVNYSAGLPIVTDITDLFAYNDGISTGVIRVSYYGRGMWESPMVTNTVSNITVSLTAPANNAVFSAPANISLTASATTTSGTISKVEFYQGSTKLGEDLTAPYTFTWSNAGIGTYQLLARAYDNSGNSVSSSIINITVNLNCTTLTGTAFGTSPAWGGSTDTYDKVFDGNTSTFFDYANANGGYAGLDLGTVKVINGIRFYPRSGQEGRMLGGKFQASNIADFSSGVVDLYTIPTTPSLSAIWYETAVANNNSYRYVRYLSPDNGYCNVAEVQFCGTQGNLSPVVNITSPASNAVFAAPANVTINATATDADGTISKVEFFQGTTKLGEDLTGPYSFNWTNAPAGTYQLTVKATDNLGAVSTSTVVTIIVNTAPAVTITAPVNNAVFTAPASVTITATASDADGTVSKVEFFQGTTKLGEDLTSPYSFNWTNAPAGTYQLTARATDNQGAVTTSSVVTIVLNGLPTVSITVPANNAVFTAPATIGITATAADADGTINKVEFFQGTTKLGEDLTSPYSFSWTNVAPGTYQLTARATDNLGAVTTSSVITVIVNNNIAPTVSITAPANNATFTAPAAIAITATAADADGTVSKVEFFQGTTKLGEDLTSPYSFSWTNVTAGTYLLTAKATDNSGTVTTSSVISIVVNEAPSVSITAPANNATFIAPATIAITATATDADGTVSKVEFFQDAVKLGEDLTSPYSFSWTNVTAGTYQLTAKATDNLGAVTTSSVITVIVNNNSTPTVSITAPANNAVFTAPAAIAISATATDADGTVSKVEFFQGNTKLGEDLTSPYSFSWSNVTAGTYLLTAKATDDLGAVATSSVITVIVNNPNGDPVVSITAPANNATFTAPASFSIDAVASDADGSIAKVEFFNGTAKLGEDLTAPYSFSMTNAAAGTYTFTARATDNLGAAATSSMITVVVYNNTAPTVSITAPANNTTFIAPATIAITATAADADGMVSKVEFFQGATKLGESLNSPYSFSWTNVAAGTYLLTAKATDNLGAVTTSATVTVIVNNNAAPLVSITAPANNTAFTGPANITITASASDADGTIGKVEFFQGTTKLGESLTSPYSFNWSNVTTGTYLLTARATDNLGATATSAVVTITVNNAAPLVNITDPANNASFTAPASFTITATASDADGSVSKVEFYQGTAKLGEDLTSPYSFDWSNVAAGTYQLTARATDNLGTVTTSSIVTVTVNNAAPSVSLTAPVNNASFTAPANITLTATASDIDGTVTKVEFYQGTTKLGEDLTSPYSYSWSNVPAGNYSLTAIATDNKGTMTVSSIVAITVKPGCTYTAWSSTAIYVQGNRCERNGDVYEAKWWTQNNDPLTNSGQWDVWKNLGVCGSNLVPSIAVTLNARNDTLFAPATFSVDVTARDDESFVTRIEIFNLTNLVSQSTGSTATYTWEDLGPGIYKIFVKAYDSDGQAAQSDTITMVIKSFVSAVNASERNARINVYPNPIVGTEVKVDYPNMTSGPVYISIVDLNGKELMTLSSERQSGAKSEVINVADLQPGMYIIKMNVSGLDYEEKLYKASRPKMK